MLSRSTLSMLSLAMAGSLFATACIQQDPASTSPSAVPNSVEKPPYHPLLNTVEGIEYITDPMTGERYVNNPGRRPVPVGVAPDSILGPLKKSAGLLYYALDWSQTVEVRIWECQTTQRYEVQSGVACGVDPDFVLVGGGARTVYFGSGALLTEARPLDYGLYTYVASSKSHKSSDPHHLHVYAIGMKLAGVTRHQLWLQTQLVSAISEPGETPYAQVPVPREMTFIGGGAKVNWTHPGSMLTMSRAYRYYWIAEAKAHKASSPATVSVYAIGIRPDIPGYGRLDIDNGGGQTIYGSGLVQAAGAVPSGWVLTCTGGTATTENGSGRMLYGLVPNPQFHGGAWAYSKDHLTGSAGYTSPTLIYAKKH